MNEGVDAEAKFKEIGEAYSVLSDSQKRAQYDQGVDLQDMHDGGGGGFGGSSARPKRLSFEARIRRGRELGGDAN